jgi:hypothetical protein
VLHSISIDARGEVSQFAFTATEFGSRGATALCRGSGGGTLARERLALDLSFTSQISQQRRRFNDAISRGFPRLLGSFSFEQRLRFAALDFESFIINTRGILADDSHVTLGAFDFLLQIRRRVFASKRVALLATDSFVQQYYCVFQPHEASARVLCGLRCRLNFARQSFSTCLELAQFAFEGE